MATYLTRAQVAGTNRKICTVSMWIKKTENVAGHEQYLFHSWADGNNRFMVSLQNDDTLQIRERSGGNTTLQIDTNRKFRDVNSWYHIVVRVDTTQSTAADRIRMYINGVQETSFSGASYPSQNLDLRMGTTDYTFYLGEYGGGGNNFSGLASHWHFADGQSLAPTVFGSTDTTTGEWKINTSPSGITYGNNGFFLFKDDNSVNDDSGEGHNFTLASGTLTKTEDNPSNVFCTLNPLSTDSGVTLSSGNTESDYDGSVGNAKGTLGFTSGKFYWEVKIATASSDYPMLGIGSLDEAQMQKTTGGSYPGGFTNSYGTYGNGNVYANGSNTGSQSFTYATNDIIGIAVDLDSGTKTIKWFKNGTQIASYNITTVAPFTSMDYNGGESAVNVQYNFGNGYFGTTAVSSAGTNASNNGIFEYDVPSGYTALSTKGLNL